jgi:nucleoside-diphosphate-sugar epimerase
MAVDGAFDEAVKGVSAVAHLATISTMDADPNKSVPQTVTGVRTLLEAAAKELSVKEVVYTGSIMAATMPLMTNDFTVGRDTWNDMAVAAAWAPPAYDPSRMMMVYGASRSRLRRKSGSLWMKRSRVSISIWFLHLESAVS